MIVVLAAAGVSLPLSLAAQTVKVGLINSYTGFVAQPADQAQKGFDLYVKEHGKELPPGVKIELLRRDDTSNPEVGKRLAQELITRDRVQLLTGIVLSPVATAVAPMTAEAKVPLLLDIASAGVTIPQSATSSPAMIPRLLSPRPSRMPAARSSGRCGSRRPIPISRRSCSASRTPSPMWSLSSCPPARRPPG
jgi:hypothetical protein